MELYVIVGLRKEVFKPKFIHIHNKYLQIWYILTIIYELIEILHTTLQNFVYHICGRKCVIEYLITLSI